MNVFRIKTGDIHTYQIFNELKNDTILVDHLIQYENEVEIGAPVFLLFGGDGTPWENGLAGICEIASNPLEVGYEVAKNGKYFKLKLKIVYRLNHHFTKMDFAKYPETFDTGIGPSTKGERNQALGIIENKKAVASLYTQPQQIIYYGVPGSGKSHKIAEKTSGISEEQKIRVVFHPEYTNADFVGQIVPTQTSDGIDYPFKAGPFTRVLKRALKNPGKPCYLIIEEINRGNAAAIFGELFQLLDRNADGWSTYGVENLDINAFIRSNNDHYSEKTVATSVPVGNITFTENTGISLPPNLSLLATMNTSDQNVFTLDNAFQRRWNMQLVKNECDDSNQMEATISVVDQLIKWKDFQSQINNLIGEKSNEGGLSSMEDKSLGCWFIKAENGKIDTDLFANKVLKYLWDDAFKFCHQEVFSSDIKNFEELQKRFLEKGFEVFNENCGFAFK